MRYDKTRRAFNLTVMASLILAAVACVVVGVMVIRSAWPPIVGVIAMAAGLAITGIVFLFDNDGRIDRR